MACISTVILLPARAESATQRLYVTRSNQMRQCAVENVCLSAILSASKAAISPKNEFLSAMFCRGIEMLIVGSSDSEFWIRPEIDADRRCVEAQSKVTDAVLQVEPETPFGSNYYSLSRAFGSSGFLPCLDSFHFGIIIFRNSSFTSDDNGPLVGALAR